MRLFLLILAISVSSACCTRRHDPADTQQDLAAYQHVRDWVAQQLDLGDVPRCDRLVAVGLTDAFLRRENIWAFQVDPGKWERSEEPCYPFDSKSEVSREGVLAAFHAIWSRQAKIAIGDLAAYGTTHGWQMGEGPAGIANVWPAAYIIKDAARSVGFIDVGFSEDRPGNPLEGFAGYVLALSLHASSRVHGFLNEIEWRALKLLAQEAPGNPVAAALRARHDDGDQVRALEMLEKDCSGGDCRGFQLWGWPSIPNWVVYGWTIAILEGK